MFCSLLNINTIMKHHYFRWLLIVTALFAATATIQAQGGGFSGLMSPNFVNSPGVIAPPSSTRKAPATNVIVNSPGVIKPPSATVDNNAQTADVQQYPVTTTPATTTTTTNQSQPTHVSSRCKSCLGSTKCKLCNGRKRYKPCISCNEVSCNHCGGSGLCQVCHGSGLSPSSY